MLISDAQQGRMTIWTDDRIATIAIAYSV